MNEAEVKAIVDKNISKPFLGVFGTETVNVLELNIYGAQNEAYMSRSAEKWVRGLCFNELDVCG